MPYLAPDDQLYESKIGTRALVFHGKCYQTSSGLTKDQLMKNKKGRIISKKRYEIGQKIFELGIMSPLSKEEMEHIRSMKE